MLPFPIHEAHQEGGLVSGKKGRGGGGGGSVKLFFLEKVSCHYSDRHFYLPYVLGKQERRFPLSTY